MQCDRLMLMVGLSFWTLSFLFSSRRRHTILQGDWSSDVCSSDLPDEQTLRAELRRQGVAPSRIRKQRQSHTGGRVNAGDIAIFARQLSTMLAAGIPLVQAFEIVGNGNDKASMQRLILDVKADVEGGTSLHESLAKHPL